MFDFGRELVQYQNLGSAAIVNEATARFLFAASKANLLATSFRMLVLLIFNESTLPYSFLLDRNLPFSDLGG